MALQNYNGLQMAKAEHLYRLICVAIVSGEKGLEDYIIFMGYLASDVMDNLLHDTFRDRYPHVKGSKVSTDNMACLSKGYGFVRFGDANEKGWAVIVMNGMFCSSIPMWIELTTTKKNTTYQPLYCNVAT